AHGTARSRSPDRRDRESFLDESLNPQFLKAVSHDGHAAVADRPSDETAKSPLSGHFPGNRRFGATRRSYCTSSPQRTERQSHAEADNACSTPDGLGFVARRERRRGGTEAGSTGD